MMCHWANLSLGLLEFFLSEIADIRVRAVAPVDTYAASTRAENP